MYDSQSAPTQLSPDSSLRRDFLVRLWQAGVVISAICTDSRPLLAANIVDAIKVTPAQKIALLVCCGSYPSGDSILPARKNGRDLEAALRRHGFEVEVENDLDLQRFTAAIERFRKHMAMLPDDGRSIGLIYFCGHGMQIDGRNYLLPAGIATNDPRARELSINLQEKLLTAFPQRYPGLGVAVIDACRTTNNAAGAFNYSTAPEGCIVAFSASAGQVALSPADPDKNSFYTQELVGALNDVDEETPITDIFELTRRRVEKTMANHPAAIVRQLAQRPHMTTGQAGVFMLGRARVLTASRNAEDDAYAKQVAALLPGDVKRSAEGFLQAYPNSRYNAQVRVALAGADDAIGALSSPFVRLSVSAFQTTKGDEFFMTDLRKALRGDKDAAERISLMYRNGHNGISQNLQRGEQWLRYSALLGNAIACYELYRSLAEKGDPDAEFFGPEAVRLGYRPPKGLCSARKSESC